MQFIEKLKNLTGYTAMVDAHEEASAEVASIQAKISEMESTLDEVLFSGDPKKLERLRSDIAQSKEDLTLMVRVREGLAIRAEEEHKKEAAAALDASMEPAIRARKDMENQVRRFFLLVDEAAKLAALIDQNQQIITSCNQVARSHGRTDIMVKELVQDVIKVTGCSAHTNPLQGFAAHEIYPRAHPDGTVWLRWAKKTAKST